jgi:hypothetical protein
MFGVNIRPWRAHSLKVSDVRASMRANRRLALDGSKCGADFIEGQDIDLSCLDDAKWRSRKSVTTEISGCGMRLPCASNDQTEPAVARFVPREPIS